MNPYRERCPPPLFTDSDSSLIVKNAPVTVVCVCGVTWKLSDVFNLSSHGADNDAFSWIMMAWQRKHGGCR